MVMGLLGVLSLSGCAALQPNNAKDLGIDQMPMIKTVTLDEKSFLTFYAVAAEQGDKINVGSIIASDPTLYRERIDYDLNCAASQKEYDQAYKLNDCAIDLSLVQKRGRTNTVISAEAHTAEPVIILKTWSYDKDIVYVEAISNALQHEITFGYTDISNIERKVEK